MDLLSASRDGQHDLVRTLLGRKADVNFKNSLDVSKICIIADNKDYFVTNTGNRSNLCVAEQPYPASLGRVEWASRSGTHVSTVQSRH